MKDSNSRYDGLFSLDSGCIVTGLYYNMWRSLDTYKYMQEQYSKLDCRN